MLKNTILFMMVTIFLGCSSLPLPEAISPSNDTSKVTANVDLENEVFAIGDAKIGDSGTLVATGKASQDAKDKLKSRIIDEEKIIFNSFLVPADPYTRKILEPALPDLMDYTATLLVQRATEKQTWIENNKAYILYTLSKGDILMESQNIFSQYLDDITNKFLIIKEGVTQTQ